MASAPKPSNPVNFCIALRTRRLSRLITRRYEHALRDSGLTVAQLSLLGTVAARQPVSPVSVARFLDLEKSSLSRNLRPLIDSKLLTAEPAARSGLTLRITIKGQDALARALPAWKKAQTEVLARMGGDTVSQLDRMIAAVSERN